MRVGSYILIAVGIILAIFGALNYTVIGLHPVTHTSSIALGAGIVLTGVGIIMMLLAGRSSSN
jgi:hypothetical protein